ncbi:hypothetical protein Pyn_29584 [Prunus yedoensis var. nudiflora]|uniref:Uncharacterized protein n=1 Tax=Prunus yedoensis var. nudiflora TaxID=2094558 RepID=A0A314UAG2_PRUYE|nr:hypothetical protein Pyn_29584 [Prunus yedoensis var. nudiflora]
MVTTVGVETRMENSQSRIRKRPLRRGTSAHLNLNQRRNGPWWQVMKELEGVDRLRNETMIEKDIMFTILARISLQDIKYLRRWVKAHLAEFWNVGTVKHESMWQSR